MEKQNEQFKLDIKRTRGVDFIKLGMKVEIDGQFGVVVGINHSANLKVKFGNRVGSCHPFWKSKYFDRKGKCITQYD
jgi:hypothetical protein